jgi:hypothetical protein
MTIGVPQKYLINGYNVRGLWYLDSYGCIVSIIPTPTFSEWKQVNGKSYWKDLAKRLSVLEVSAEDKCGCDYCPTITEREAQNLGYRAIYILSANSYEDFCKFFNKNEYVRWKVVDDWWVDEFKDVDETKIIGRSFEVGYEKTAVYSTEHGAMLRYNKCGCKNEYKYILPVFALVPNQQLYTHEREVEEYNQNHPEITPPEEECPTELEVNISRTEVLNPKFTWANCTPEEIEEIHRALDSVKDDHTEINWGENSSGYQEEPKLTELDGNWSEVDESIFEMYPIHNPPTIYVMQVSSGWDYHTFKLPIYRRI